MDVLPRGVELTDSPEPVMQSASAGVQVHMQNTDLHL